MDTVCVLVSIAEIYLMSKQLRGFTVLFVKAKDKSNTKQNPPHRVPLPSVKGIKPVHENRKVLIYSTIAKRVKEKKEGLESKGSLSLIHTTKSS